MSAALYLIKKQEMYNFLKKMQMDGLLDGKGRALDLGCGDGKHTLSLLELGYEVDAVDKDDTKILDLKNKKINGLQAISSTLEQFDITPSTYSVIIMSNVLPFISDKDTVEKILKKAIAALTSEGKMYFTLFGTKDEWVGKEGMSFFEYSEACALLEKVGLKIYYKSNEEGMGLTMKGTKKYWNIFKFICTK